MDGLEAAIEYAGGVTKLADLLGVRQSAVSNWRNFGEVPVKRCPDFERVTAGTVTRYDLRPDFFGRAPRRTA